jgi:hypothetical protein
MQELIVPAFLFFNNYFIISLHILTNFAIKYRIKKGIEDF